MHIGEATRASERVLLGELSAEAVEAAGGGLGGEVDLVGGAVAGHDEVGDVVLGLRIPLAHLHLTIIVLYLEPGCQTATYNGRSYKRIKVSYTLYQ